MTEQLKNIGLNYEMMVSELLSCDIYNQSTIKCPMHNTNLDDSIHLLR